MNCPHCASTITNEPTQKTTLGSRTFRCSACKRPFNERTGTPFNFLEYPTDVVLLVVLWRHRYKLSDAWISLKCFWRGASCSPMKPFGTLKHGLHPWWQTNCGENDGDRPEDPGRWMRHISAVHGKWSSLYRAIDDGNLVDSRLSEKRDMEAAQRFFQQALSVVGHAPGQVTTDGHASYPQAVREILGSSVEHRTNTYLNNRLEQDHRGVKQRYYPMRGFGNFASAVRFCRAFDEVRNYFRPHHTMGETLSLMEQRRLFCEKLAVLQLLVLMAS